MPRIEFRCLFRLYQSVLSIVHWFTILLLLMAVTRVSGEPINKRATSGLNAHQVNSQGYWSARHQRNFKGVINYNSLMALVRAQWFFNQKTDSNQDQLVVQFRPVIDNESRKKNYLGIFVDEMYWEHPICFGSTGFLGSQGFLKNQQPLAFVTLGRQKHSYGVAMGRNPSDFFNQYKPRHRGLSDEDRRNEQLGDDSVGWMLLGDSYTLEAVVADQITQSPVYALQAHRHLSDSKDQKGAKNQQQTTTALLRWQQYWDTWMMDTELLAYYGPEPALAVNFTRLMGDSTLVYTEMAVRLGRDRPTPKRAWNAVSGNYQFMAEPDRQPKLYPDGVIGIQYSFEPNELLLKGATLNVEYWYNTQGFSVQEYQDIVDSLGNKGREGSYVDHSSKSARALLGMSDLRQQTLFVRLGDLALFPQMDADFVWINDLNDSSQLISSRIHFDLNDNSRIRFVYEKTLGNPLSQYGRKAEQSFFVSFKRFF